MTVLVAAAAAAVVLPHPYHYGYSYGAYPYYAAPLVVSAEAPKVEVKTVEAPKTVELKTLPLAYSYGYAHHAPLAYSVAAPAPVAYAAPVAYTTGFKVETKSEPVEQHGYEIRY